MGAATLEFTCREAVRYADCDLHAHMNHASYISFFEDARIQYFRAAGLQPCGRRESIPFIVVHVRCDYRAQVELHEELVLSLGVTRFGTTSFTMTCHMDRASDGVRAAELEAILVCYDYATSEPVPVFPHFKRAVLELQRREGAGD